MDPKEAMDSVGVSKMASKLPAHETRLTRWLAGSSDSVSQCLNAFGVFIDAPQDNFYGIASIQFPSLRPNAVLWMSNKLQTYKRHGEPDNYTPPLPRP